MALRKQIFAPGEYYHLYNRGTEKRKIFLHRKDYEYFLDLFYLCNSTKNIEKRDIGENFDRGKTLVDIGAYCLMPNHFHILVKEKIEGGISKFMLKVMTGYSMYFNKKYNRTGKLYEGVFKATHASTDTYLKYLYSYIHLNPAKLLDKNWRDNIKTDKKKLLGFCLDYAYSSIREYRYQNFKITNPQSFPIYFKKFEEYKEELVEWLNFNQTN